MDVKHYQNNLERDIEKIYNIANNARAKGFDPFTEVEIMKAKDLAARVEGLVGPENSANKIRKILKRHNREKAALVIIDKIMNGEFGDMGGVEKRAEQALRTSLTILTEGILVAGTEGVSKIKICENPDGSKYLSVYFASPIRSAGGTAAGYAVMVADYIRKIMGLQRYRPTESEIARYVEEIVIYHNSISRLQYFPKEDEIRHIIKNCPVCIDGGPTTMLEVSLYKNLARVETNCIRGGMCLVIAEGIAQKTSKLLRFSKEYDLGWDWIEGLIKVEKKSGGGKGIEPVDLYLSDIVGGRPIFAYPSSPGGFRLRYGKSRNSGINAKCIHPVAMYIMDEFPAIGTQLKIERPGKGCAITPCDSIEPPMVRLKNGDVLRIDKVDKAVELKDEISEILFLGDILISYGDFLKANHSLLPSGICEEWWKLIAIEKGLEVDAYNISPNHALELSEKYKIPLHPRYTYFYADISKDELVKLIQWLKKGELEKLRGFGRKEVLRFILDFSEEKRFLERLCIPHKVRGGRIIVEDANIIVKTFGLDKEISDEDLEKLAEEKKDSLEVINHLADFPVYNKAPVYIGARMGRPEKAKERMMSPPPHGLTPVGNFGGKTRSVEKAAEKGKVSLDVPKLICPECGSNLFEYACRKCGQRAELMHTCEKCGRPGRGSRCSCGGFIRPYHKGIIDMKAELEKVLERLGEELPPKVKGVLGTTNAERFFEPLDKTILRAKHNVYVFKDGTSRFDATNLPLSHFKPVEIGTSVEKLKELGYSEDYRGNKLIDENQIVELLPQDIVISERNAEYFIRVSKFIDDLLEKFYGMERFYNIQDRKDLIGHLIVGMAPHISAGTLGRIIGFTRARGTYAHAYFHCAVRRDCDGDEDSVTLLLDALLNFSRKYLPDKSGGTEDIPLILSTKINPSEVDDQVFSMETVKSFPLEFYEATQKNINPVDIEIETVEDRLGKENESYGLNFTFDTTRIDEGPNVTQYSQLKTMGEKVERQLELARKIRAVNEKDVASRVLNFHFLRDIYGNLRSFGQQTFRCVDCNRKYRRVPLVGKCTRCGGKILLTVHKGGIEKYLNISQEIAEKYGLSDYLKQRLSLIERDLEAIFEPEKIKQYSLADFI